MSIEFKLSNTGIQRMTTSQWECRNIGLEKILNGAYPYIMKEIVDIKKPIKIIISHPINFLSHINFQRMV